MTNPKGTAFETPIADFLVGRWCPFIVRSPKHGTRDKGDIANFLVGKLGGQPVALELKNHRGLNLAGWWKEALTEAGNLGTGLAAVIHKRHGKSLPADQWVTQSLGNWLETIEAAWAAGVAAERAQRGPEDLR